MIRILVADDHEVLRWGLVQILSVQPDMVVVAEVGDTDAAIEASDRLVPDVLLLDLSMPGGAGGWTVLERVLAKHPDACVVIHSAADDAHTVETALARGARAHVSKSDGSAHLLGVLRSVVGDLAQGVGAVASSPDRTGGPEAAGGAGSGDPGAG